jgi:hypothetical protein
MSDIGCEGYVHLAALTTCCVWVDRTLHANADCVNLKDRRVIFVRELPPPIGGTYPLSFTPCQVCYVEKCGNL